MNEVDRLVRMRARMLLFSAFALALWQFGWLGSDLLELRGGKTLLIAQVSTVLGSLAWVAASTFFFMYSRRVKKADGCVALDDEHSRHNRFVAFRAGYVVLFAVVFVLIPAVNSFGLDGGSGLRIAAIIGLVTPMISFASLEMQSDPGEEQ